MILREFDRDNVNLVPDTLLMESPLELSQYMIEKWQLVFFDEGTILEDNNK